MDDERRRKERGRFYTTPWGDVLAAGNSAHPEYRRALDDLCRIYWYPLYAYVRRRGYAHQDASDLVQGYFAMLLEKRRLRVVDPGRGRFRSFLLTSLKNYMANEWGRGQAQKRGGSREPLPLDLDAAEGRYEREPADHETPDRVYDRRWAMTLLGRALERLRDEADRSASPDRFRRLSQFLTDADVPYKQVAEELRMTESAVKVAVHRLRARYGQLLRDEVAQTVDDAARVDDEIRHLFEAVKS